MKKNLLFILSIFVLSISFVACSDDGENEETEEAGNNNAPQFIASRNYSDFLTYYTTEEKATYNTSSNKLNISFDFGTDRFEIGDKVYIQAYYKLLFKFSVDINNLKVGDELQNKLEDNSTDIKFTDYTTVGDYGHENYINGGKLIVKSIDTTNKKISIEFQNLDIWRNQYYMSGDNKKMKEFIIKRGILEFQYK